eukprot:scaffold9049_cov71-Phaeocystis_antarctica.AAC.4
MQLYSPITTQSVPTQPNGGPAASCRPRACPRLKEARRCSAGVCAVIHSFRRCGLLPVQSAVTQSLSSGLQALSPSPRPAAAPWWMRSTAAAACGACGSQRMRPRPASPPRAGSHRS